jgi:S-formylglutathione hydrolase FrmB
MTNTVPGRVRRVDYLWGNVRSLLRRALLAAIFIAALGLAPGAAGIVLRGGHGLRVFSQRSLDARLLAVSVSSPALLHPANVRILLPAAYSKHPRRRYPVLYLLHGTSGRAADWTTMGGAERTTAGRSLIVVMPDIAFDGDGGGWCTNWWNGGAQGRPDWETFHVGELVPWIDANLRTLRARGERAIAGLSQGGFCSMSYAARHPDLFGVALSFSGAPDIAYDAEAQSLVTPIINLTETSLDGVPANSMFGPRTTEEINWAAHDPTTLAGNLRDTRLRMYTGDGKPGPFDHTANPLASALEAGVEQLTMLFHRRLQKLGISSFYDDYGPGTHSWPYWDRDLRQAIGPLMADFATPVSVPRRFSYMSADASFAVYGWRVRMRRAVREFATLADARDGGFTLKGSGSATVTTPARYPRGARYLIRIGTKTISTRVGRARRLRIDVPLGPSNGIQEYPHDGPATGTTVYAKRVSIARRRDS